MDTRHSLTKTTFRAWHIEGELTVEAGLPAELAQNLFATPGRYQTVMRLSTQLGDILNDAVPATRGMAIKMFGVECERLLDSADDRTENFVLASDPAFFTPDAQKFLNSPSNSPARWTRRNEQKVPSVTLRSVRDLLEAMGGVPITHHPSPITHRPSAGR